jgi:DNA-binding transcriptional LysR family regulator
MTNLNELQFFTRVAETGSLTAAAETLALPKSTISRGLSRLETRLGIRLIERTTRRLMLTEAGEVYLKFCREAMKEVERGERALNTLRGAPKGRLRVGVPVMFARVHLTPILPEFLERYPDIQLHLIFGGCDRNVLESNLDMLIQSGPVIDSEMFVRRLGQVDLGLVAGREYIEKHGQPGTPDDIDDHRCLTLKESGQAASWQLRRDEEHVVIRPEPRFSVGNSLILHELARAGMGIAMLPLWMISDDLETGNLVRILPDWTPLSVDIHAIYPSPLDLTPKARVFLEFVVERLEL